MFAEWNPTTVRIITNFNLYSFIESTNELLKTATEILIKYNFFKRS
jgi:hypothetical protein